MPSSSNRGTDTLNFNQRSDGVAMATAIVPSNHVAQVRHGIVSFHPETLVSPNNDLVLSEPRLALHNSGLKLCRSSADQNLQPPQSALVRTTDNQHSQRTTAEDSHSANISLDIANHPQGEVVNMLSSLLTKITTSNDTLLSSGTPITREKFSSPMLAFHARNVPSISIHAYLSRILKYCPMTSDIFLSLLVYFDRMGKMSSHIDPSGGYVMTNDSNSTSFTSTSEYLAQSGRPFAIDSFNVHRLVITGIVVASKFCSDVFYTNSRYAKVWPRASPCH